MLCDGKQNQYCYSPSVLKQADDVSTEPFEWPPAVLTSDPVRIALSSLGCQRTGLVWGLYTGWDDELLCGVCRCSLRLRSRRRLRFWCRLCPRAFWPRAWVGRGREDHLGLLGCRSAHVRFDHPGSLAGVGEFPQIPHYLDEVVPGVFVVGAARMRLAPVFTPVWVPVAPAWQPQPGVVPLASDDHGAQVLVLGVERDRIVPDGLSHTVIALSRSWPNTAEQQQSASQCPHGVRWCRMAQAEGPSCYLLANQTKRDVRPQKGLWVEGRSDNISHVAVWREQMFNQLVGWLTCIYLLYNNGLYCKKPQKIAPI